MLIGDVWISPPMVAELSELTGVHRTTVQRWLRTKKLPEAIYQLLDLLLNGSIARIHCDWHGWSIDTKTGELVTPVGTSIKPGEVLALPYRYHQIATLERKVRELQNELSAIRARNGCGDADVVEIDNRASAGKRP